ncbi:hypothetical protein YPPY34_3605 [Yersinia pestis PY-34]|nr:hypothetical protein YP516_1017 [Yersinia pestis Nepal516]EEO79798.1 hypothetical protein YPF_3793 [Yersinia pestis biovar Orientalis str. India 195]EEO89043.1 hypothetical protein YPS_3902 [Yersinia pestis Pestoides A]EIR00196.1 hypothetical protein YPPY05_3579 [Yersinia pestis PY-05]EIR30859.1 hypothetical protein YPPY12_3763 [Yersinia pestis PY-12]EIR44897.1 hypothetical protein YPPY14_3543 [Yersinia pestis PY-14]EIR73412.1 hypothetical protein YPPY34_3605 [Yersinia pestis PY-34]EIS022
MIRITVLNHRPNQPNKMLIIMLVKAARPIPTDGQHRLAA